MRLSFRSLLVCAIAVACAGIPSGTAFGYAIPKRAVFEGTTSNEWEDWGWWTSRLNGSEPERIFPDVDPGGASPRNPKLSPDGLEIAFDRYEYKTGDDCLEVTSVEGGRAVPVYCSYSVRDVTWSPNGYELAFTGYTESTEGEGLLIFNLRTEELRVVADWIGPQRTPSFSPDGSRIVFDSPLLPNEEALGGLYVVNSNGTGVEQLTEGFHREPDWSPDGKQIVVEAYQEPAEEEPEEEDEGGFAVLNSTTGAVEEWLLQKDYETEFEPRWSPDGDLIYFEREIEEGPFEGEEERYVIEAIAPNGTERHEVLPEFFWAIRFSPQEASAVEPDPPATLLKRYEPRLHFDLQEQYFADSAREAVDGPENRILASDRETIVAAHEFPYEHPTLTTLEEPAASFGVIDEGPEYSEDAANMHAEGEYADKAYGRVFHDESTNADWLDYWFYYYYDAQSAGITETGVHEGDWEHVAFRLDNRGVPDLAVYSRHGSETGACSASAINWEVTDGTTISPNVYVANASHANYFGPGEYNRDFPRPTDQANGDGASISPSVTEVDSAPFSSVTAEPQWFYWNGTWGVSEEHLPVIGDFESPGSPPRDSAEWEDLQTWAEEHEDNCEVEGSELSRAAKGFGSSRRALARPATPSLRARRAGDGILIRYNLSSHGVEAESILLTVTAKDKLDATRSKTSRMKTNQGTIHLPLPLADGPYIATASTFTAKGERSDTQVVGVAP